MFKSEKSDSEVCDYNCNCVYFNLMVFSFPSIQSPELKDGRPEADIANPDLDIYNCIIMLHAHVLILGEGDSWQFVLLPTHGRGGITSLNIFAPPYLSVCHYPQLLFL